MTLSLQYLSNYMEQSVLSPYLICDTSKWKSIKITTKNTVANIYKLRKLTEYMWIVFVKRVLSDNTYTYKPEGSVWASQLNRGEPFSGSSTSRKEGCCKNSYRDSPHQKQVGIIMAVTKTRACCLLICLILADTKAESVSQTKREVSPTSQPETITTILAAKQTTTISTITKPEKQPIPTNSPSQPTTP